MLIRSPNVHIRMHLHTRIKPLTNKHTIRFKKKTTLTRPSHVHVRIRTYTRE